MNLKIISEPIHILKEELPTLKMTTNIIKSRWKKKSREIGSEPIKFSKPNISRRKNPNPTPERKEKREREQITIISMDKQKRKEKSIIRKTIKTITKWKMTMNPKNTNGNDKTTRNFRKNKTIGIIFISTLKVWYLFRLKGWRTRSKSSRRFS